jgi:poly(ADP-ribose) glycohydrolase ARH3
MADDDVRRRFEGAVLGLALGDALCAPFEGGPLERLVWSLIGRTREGKRRWTDDTRMSLDLIECLVAHRCVDQDDLAMRFARSYRWSRGYGPGTARVLKRIRRGGDWRRSTDAGFAGGSFGNGGAMRAPVLGLFHRDDAEALDAATQAATVVTHAHPLAVEGATMVARATVAALAGDDGVAVIAAAQRVARSEAHRRPLSTAAQWCSLAASSRERAPDPRRVARTLGNGTTATASCATAIYLAARFLREDFMRMQAFIARCGGDADTIAAMAGAIWGAANGVDALPREALEAIEDVDGLRDAAVALHAAWQARCAVGAAG